MMEKKENTIKAEDGMTLRRKADGLLFGQSLRLGYTYYIGGEKLAAGHLEVPEDYEEVLSIEVEGRAYAVERKDYSYLKGFIVKLKYSNDDQIAIMLNYERQPDDAAFAERYTEMQAWRDEAGKIAREEAAND